MAAIDGAKFKAVNARDRNFTKGKLKRHIGQVEQSIERYLQSLDAADRGGHRASSHRRPRGHQYRRRQNTAFAHGTPGQGGDGAERIDFLADQGYFSGEEILACEAIDVTPYVPKPCTSGAKAAGRFGKDDFVYDTAENLSLPGGRDAHLSLHDCRGGPHAPRILDDNVR